jgi:hypothetical protein
MLVSTTSVWPSAGVRDLVGGERGRGARFVLDDHGLAQRLRQLLGVEPRHHVHAGAGRQRNHDSDGLGRVFLRRAHRRMQGQ